MGGETEQLYATIAGFEEATREATARADQADCDIRDLGKKIQNLEMNYDKNLKSIEEELETVGENMKQLEKSAEKALEREEKLVEKILSLQNKFKVTEARFEY